MDRAARVSRVALYNSGMTPMTSLPVIVSAGEALTDLVRVDRDLWRSHPGGAGWNVARACAALGVPAAFAGAVGKDVFGDDITRSSQEAGLDVRFLQRNAHPTLMAVVHEVSPPAYAFLGENSADLHFDPDALPSGWEGAARWVHLGGISLARAPLNRRLLDLAARARHEGARVSFDPNARITHADPAYRPILERTLALADLIKLSDEDVRFFYAGLSEPDAVRAMREHNAYAPIVITRGGHGVHLYEAEAEHGATLAVPAVPVQVVDTVGAGDAFVAGLLAHATRHPEAGWADAVRFAARVAAVACTRPGAYAPTLAEVNALDATGQS